MDTTTAPATTDTDRIKAAIGYDPIRVSITGHPEIRETYRTADDADGLVRRLLPVLEEVRAEAREHIADDALRAVLALHREEVRYQPSTDAEVSYDTPEECREAWDLSEDAPLTTFSLCVACKTVEDGPCDGDCTLENGYRESLWPCATVRAIEDALRG